MLVTERKYTIQKEFCVSSDARKIPVECCALVAVMLLVSAKYPSSMMQHACADCRNWKKRLRLLAVGNASYLALRVFVPAAHGAHRSFPLLLSAATGLELSVDDSLDSLHLLAIHTITNHTVLLAMQLLFMLAVAGVA